MAVYIAQVGDDTIKIGYSHNPYLRLPGLANQFRKDVTLLCVMNGTPIRELVLQEQFSNCRQPGALETFNPAPGLLAFIAANKLKNPIFRKYVPRSEWKKPASFMTPQKIRLAGDMLNGRNGQKRLSGPKAAKKLKVSTASIYANWKQKAPGVFVRKPKKP